MQGQVVGLHEREEKKASFEVALVPPVEIENLFVRNVGSELVEVEAMAKDGTWSCLMSSAQLLSAAKDNFFLARFFVHELSRALKGVVVARLRVIVTPGVADQCFGLAAFGVNKTPDELAALRAAGPPQRVPDELAELRAAAVAVTVPVAAPAPSKQIVATKSAVKSSPAPTLSKRKESKKKAIELIEDVEDFSDDHNSTPLKKAKTVVSTAPAPSSTPVSSLGKAKTTISPVAAPSPKTPAANRGSILKGVVFGLSGLENRQRSKIRDLPSGWARFQS